jgi:hypothetical protein
VARCALQVRSHSSTSTGGAPASAVSSIPSVGALSGLSASGLSLRSSVSASACDGSSGGDAGSSSSPHESAPEIAPEIAPEEGLAPLGASVPAEEES